MDATNQLAVRESTAIVQPAEELDYAGFEGIGQSDFIIPRWTIVQPTSRYEGGDEHMGWYHRNIDGAFARTLDVVILKATPTRLLWSGDLSERMPECSSHDGKVGITYGACNQCQYNRQVNAELRQQLADGMQVKACSFGYTFLVVDDLEEQSLAYVGAMGTSVRPARILMTQLYTRKKATFGAIITLATERMENQRGKFYVLKGTVKRWLDTPEIREWAEIAKAMSTTTIREYQPVETEAVGMAGDFGSDDVPF